MTDISANDGVTLFLGGPPGYDGWTPLTADVDNGNYQVKRVLSWAGGRGTAPPVGYLKADGTATDDINLAFVTGLSLAGQQALINGTLAGPVTDASSAATAAAAAADAANAKIQALTDAESSLNDKVTAAGGSATAAAQSLQTAQAVQQQVTDTAATVATSVGVAQGAATTAQTALAGTAANVTASLAHANDSATYAGISQSFAGSNIFASTALGVAGVADGRYFVWNDSGTYRLYLRSGSTAVDQHRIIPSGADVDAAVANANAALTIGNSYTVKIAALKETFRTYRAFTQPSDVDRPTVLDLDYRALESVVRSTGGSNPVGTKLFHRKIAGAGFRASLQAQRDIIVRSVLDRYVRPNLRHLVLWTGTLNSLVPTKVDLDWRFLEWFDSTTGQRFSSSSAADAASSGSSAPPAPLAAGTTPMPTQRNHTQGYGQSNNLGHDAIPPIPGDTTPSNYHLTFGKGITATKPGLSGASNPDDGTEKALVEEVTNPDGGTSGENAMFQLARGSTRRWLARSNATPPKMFAGCAGKGGTSMSGIGIGSAWYPNLRYQTLRSFQLAQAAAQNWSVPFVTMDHTETDNQINTPKNTYKTALGALIDGYKANVLTDTGYSGPIHWLFSVSTLYIGLGAGGAVDAVSELCEERDDCHFVVATYRLPQINTLHLSPEGQALKGEFYSRGIDAIWQGYEPPCIGKPNLYFDGTEVVLSAKSPTALRLNTQIIGQTPNNGFAVEDTDGLLTLDNFRVTSDGLFRFRPNRVPGTGAQVRYAKDYLAPGLMTLNGASGNLFDSTTDTVVINSNTYSLAHAMRPFTLPLYIAE